MIVFCRSFSTRQRTACLLFLDFPFSGITHGWRWFLLSRAEESQSGCRTWCPARNIYTHWTSRHMLPWSLLRCCKEMKSRDTWNCFIDHFDCSACRLPICAFWISMPVFIANSFLWRWDATHADMRSSSCHSYASGMRTAGDDMSQICGNFWS